MKESDVEGVATHDGPESCVEARKGLGEALTREHAGRVLSREISSPGCRRGYDTRKATRGGASSQAPDRPRAVGDPLHAWNLHAREPGDPLTAREIDGSAGRAGKAGGRTPAMHGQRKSDGFVVPAKRLNNADTKATEAVEGRSPTKGNEVQQNAHRTQSRTSAHSELDRVREVARRNKGERFTALLHHITIERLREAFGALAKKAAPGVDGVTWKGYAVKLEENLRDLHTRLHQGRYRARPSRRVYISKSDGRKRPLGVAALEDKVLQRTVAAVLNTIYETDFLGFSYGFRRGRSQHDALDALATGIQMKKVNWVLDADIRGFFDSIDHDWMVRFVEHRIADRRLLRLIQKWLTAGVMENGEWTKVEEGTPQGATISPLLANIYLHYVLDLWIQQWRKRHAYGDVIMVRWADDFIVGLERREDAERLVVELRARLRKFNLELHPEKTRLIAFGRFAAQRRKERGFKKPETFTFLGFTHMCGKTRAGKFQLRRHSEKKRMRQKLQEIKLELHRKRHLPIPAQGIWLAAVVRGFFAYHAVPTNVHALQAFKTQIVRHWLHALRRRSQRHRMKWSRMRKISERWLPKPRILHPWPIDRFSAKTQGKSPVR